jgi:enolase-phosphatase E1
MIKVIVTDMVGTVQQSDTHGALYEDAVRNLQSWKEKGIRLFTYSSNSVRAQKLLFSQNPFGDLTSLFSGYYDTRVGHKRESSSYEVIASEINERAGDILFLSDTLDELNAARAAGMQTRWLVRGSTPLDTMASHPQVKDFDAISLD